MQSDPEDNGMRSAPSVDHPVVRNGRVDAAASQIDDIRRAMKRRPWIDGRALTRARLVHPGATHRLIARTQPPL